MKKRVLTLVLALAVLCSLGGTALASNAVVDAELTYNGITVQLDGKTIVLADSKGNGVEPFIIGGTTYLPVRAVAGALGLDVGWDGASSTVILTSGGQVVSGSGSQLKSTRKVMAELNYRNIKITLDGTALVPKDSNGHAVEPFIIGGTTYLPIRGIASALGLEVGWDGATATVSLTSGGQGGGQTPGGQTGGQPSGGSGEGVSYRTVSVNTSVGAVSAHVLTVDLKNSAVDVRPTTAKGTICSRASLADIVAAAGNPLAVITANFMGNDKDGNYPIGTFMVDGNLLFTGGVSSIGIKNDGSMVCGSVGIRARVVPDSGDAPLWNGNAINPPENEIEGNITAVYTPAIGTSFTAVPGGSALTVSGGKVSSFRVVAPGEQVAIPADGYVLLMTSEYFNYVNSWNYRDPVPGEGVKLEYSVSKPDGSFTSLDGVKHIISGGRLVKNGAICTDIEPEFNDEAGRFTTLSTSRICAGYTADGKLILVSSSGLMQAMRELMLSLGCVEAINLDGGASAALYYNGKTIVPEGRLLAYALLIYSK